MGEDYVGALKQVILLSQHPGNKPVYVNKALLLHTADQLEDVVNLIRNQFLTDQPFKPASNGEYINLFNLIASKLILPNKVLSVYCQLVNGSQALSLEQVVSPLSVRHKVTKKPMPPFDPHQERIQGGLDVVSTLEVPNEDEEEYEEEDEPIYNPDPLANVPLYSYNENEALNNLADSRPQLPTELQGNSQPSYVPPEVGAQQKPVAIPFNSGQTATFHMSKKLLMQQEESPIGSLAMPQVIPQEQAQPRPGMVIQSPNSSVPVHIHSTPSSDGYVPAVKVNMQELTRNMK